MTTNKIVHNNLSSESTLSNNSELLSVQSSSSLDEEFRLSNARRKNSGASGNNNNIGRGGAGAGAGGRDAADRDMTEDEVAIMVRNALRKARRAMDSSSPSMSQDSDDGVGINDTNTALDDYDYEDDSPQGGGRTTYDNNSTTASTTTKKTSSKTTKMRGSVRASSANKLPPIDTNMALPDPSQTRTESTKSEVSDEVDFDSSPNTNNNNSNKKLLEEKSSEGDNSTHNDLAKRIEEEIQSARAFAEQKYYANNAGAGIEGGKGKSKENSKTRTSTTSRGGSTKDRKSSRSRDKIAATNDKIVASSDKLRNTTRTSSLVANNVNTNVGGDIDATTITMEEAIATTTPGGTVSAAATNHRPPVSPPSQQQLQQQQISPNPKTPGANEFDAILEVTPGQPPALPTPTKKSSLSNDPDEEIMDNNDDNNQILVMQEVDDSNEGKTNSMDVLSPSNACTTTTIDAQTTQPDSTPLTANSNNKPQQHQHRQVLFRHPYPLPPPPSLPRSDTDIIESNTAPDKNINIRWVEPDNDLESLIEAAGEEYNLVRRSNACGALKVLASKDGNKSKLCRTKGLLDVLVKASWDDAVDSDALDARTRAVSTLLYLSEPKDNRLIVAKHHQVLECLVKVIHEDTGEARWRATSTLATLAKTPGNRGLMARVEGLPTVLGNLMIEGVEVQLKEEGQDDANKEGDGGADKNTESREDDASTIMESVNYSSTMDEDEHRMLTNTYSGTFTEGTGTTFNTEDDTYAYDSDTHDGTEMLEEAGSQVDDDRSRRHGDDDWSHADSMNDDDEDGSVQEEEGVEMQISSLKKLNIENASDFLAKSQLSACATLTHLTKHCANAPALCKNDELLKNIIFLGGIFERPLHTRCIEMVCNMTRFPRNNARLASMPSCIDMLLHCGKSKIAEDRMWAIRTIQNLCSDASSKVGLATSSLLSLLSTAAMRKDYEEQYAAVGALMNLSTEPGSIVPLTNTKTVVATLVHLAHSPNTPGAVRKIACDSLATIGLWLQTLASAGTVPEAVPFSPLPTHSATGWLRWES